MERTYIAIDLKSFYASVECAARGLDPLTTNLVVADPERTDKTICLAVSPSMKALGVRNRCRVFEIPKDIEYIMAKPRMQLYIDTSAEIYATYLKFVSKDDIHVYSIDECFIDATSYLRLYRKSAHELARDMIRAVLQKTGITATAGIGTNLYLAKIAMDIVAKHVEADSDGVRLAELDEMLYRKLLWEHRPLTDFWRIGPGIAERLAGKGLYTMGDIARASLSNEDMLYRLFGVDAELLIDHAWGYEPCRMEDIKNYRPKINSLGAGQVLSSAYSFDKARIVMQEMAESLALEMVEKNLVSDSISVMIGYDAVNTSYLGELKTNYYGKVVPRPAGGTIALEGSTNSMKKIAGAALELFERTVNPALSIRRISITANNTQPLSFAQRSLFETEEEDEEQQKLQRTLLDIKKRFGKNAILKGLNFKEGATQRDRNAQIGGHKA
ncbi:MAG: Y-family DNA polymerase [Spirochaetales bacterium]|nr:Y-family DNA polymerase [Spirochaetales bacterium]